MKKPILAIIISIITAFCGEAYAQSTASLFPYPTVPEDVNMTLSERCNYLVYRFWDRCNIKESFSSLNKLDDAFGTWLSYMPYATADTVHLAIDNFIKSVEKSAPKQMLEVGKMANNWLYSDTSKYYSEEIYEPFCEAVVRCKKVPNADKALYKTQLQILQSSALGKRVPGLSFTTPQGDKGSLDDVLASRVILFFNDPDCIDCSLAKARLSADYNTKRLIELGLLKIVSLYPGEATDEWKAEAAKYPDNWVVGASPDLDLYFDLPDLPVLYYLDGRHKVLGKNIPIDNLLVAVRTILDGVNKSAEE